MTNMKRCHSDSESDHDDLDDLKVGSPSQSCNGPDRKKRRGVIEKRRRDRINNSLAELRRLVPTAFEKQGSAKLEKAEILQMTVDHLKILHQKGLNGYNFDPAALAMDYRSVGFRECAAEVARYLVTCEGMDIQDPLRLRLMSHLQCYSAQREVATKATLQNSFQSSSWNSLPSHHGLNSQYNTGGVGAMPPPPPHSMISQHGTQTDQLSLTTTQLSAGLSTVSCADTRLSQHAAAAAASVDSSHHHHHHMRLSGVPTTGSVAPQIPSISNSGHSGQMAPPVIPSQYASMHSQFPMSLSVNSMPMLSPSGGHNYSPPSSTTALGQAVKPYRPWGAELAY